VKQTDTPEFKRWFADSVVSDDAGIPMVVYHGTVNYFNVFDSSKVTYSMWNGFGNWFTTDRKYAEVFSGGIKKVGRVIEAYLSIQSPLIYDGDDKVNGFNRMIQEFEEVTGKKTYDATPEDAAAFREYIQSLGFDGVIIFQWTGDKGLSERPVDIYIALESNQIKSATENRGTFDSGDPDIRNPRQLMGININDKCQDFTGQILRGEKTIETRKTRSLDPYIGERIGIIRTGVGKATLVGYATVGEPVVYDSVAKFRRDYDKHLVAPGSAFDIKDGLKYGYPLMQVESVEPRQVESRGIVARRLNPYTKPDLRERLKRKVMAGSKGGNPGQWSARKAQLLAAEYEKAGGGYTGKRSASQKSLSKWSQQDWRTKSGKPSLQTGERYLPAKAIEGLTAAEYAATTRAKRKATGQFSRQPKRIAMKTKEFRNPMDPRSAMTQIATTVNTYRKASKMLDGKVLDYGAGYGLGTDAMREEGLLAESFEPFPEEWKGKQPPTYTDSANIPSSAYDSLVSFSVINVVDPDERKFLFKEVARILRPDGFALITGRTRQDVSSAKIKKPHLEDGGYLIGEGEDERYQKGFTQAELERYAKEVLGPDFTVEKNGMLNGASIKITKGKTNPTKRNAIRNKLSRIIESDDRILCYDTATDEDFYRLWDIIHTDLTLNKESLREIEGMLDDDGVLVIESGESPAALQDHFRKATRYQGLLLVQGPLNPEQARIETEKLRRDLE